MTAFLVWGPEFDSPELIFGGMQRLWYKLVILGHRQIHGVQRPAGLPCLASSKSVGDQLSKTGRQHQRMTHEVYSCPSHAPT